MKPDWTDPTGQKPNDALSGNTQALVSGTDAQGIADNFRNIGR